ncbi:MAG: DUF1259 domain-containing protein [Betaproteobacteria bacterium]
MKTWLKYACLTLVVGVALPVTAAELDLSSVEALIGLKGKFNDSEGVFKVTFPRTDIKAPVAGVRLNPELGLTAWAAFTRAGDHTMVMGDIVMLESEVNPVMSVALDNGLDVTALHNHFLWDNPKVMFMHIGGMGEGEKLAGAVGKVFDKLKAVIQDEPKLPFAQIDPAQTSLDGKRIAEIVGTPGSLKDGVYKIVIGRTVDMGGHKIGKEMGVNTWAAFAGSDELAVVDGDFAMLESEVQDVLKALRAGRINIVAIHNHMTFENPRMVFLHYWGIGPTAQLARTLRTALDTQRLD